MVMILHLPFLLPIYLHNTRIFGIELKPGDSYGFIQQH